mmetsp:Transcript_11102/g.36818  ORF Transcript_11102/g.36818 Transcript_11102/m.36818 type:complete len:267 (-) Transcript_11102:132-932(-)
MCCSALQTPSTATTTQKAIMPTSTPMEARSARDSLPVPPTPGATPLAARLSVCAGGSSAGHGGEISRVAASAGGGTSVSDESPSPSSRPRLYPLRFSDRSVAPRDSSSRAWMAQGSAASTVLATAPTKSMRMAKLVMASTTAKQPLTVSTREESRAPSDLRPRLLSMMRRTGVSCSGNVATTAAETTKLAASKRAEKGVPSKRAAMSAVMEAELMSGKAMAVAAATIAKMATTADSAPLSREGYRCTSSSDIAFPTGIIIDTPSSA